MALIESFVNRTLPDVFGCPLNLVEQAVLDSLREFADRTWTIRAGFSLLVESLGTSNSAATLDLSTVMTDGHRVVAVDDFRIDGQPHGLQLRNLVAMQNESYLTAPGGPWRYFDIPTATSLRIYPSSIGEVMDGVAICVPLETATEVPDILYDEWSEAIMAGAKARLLSMPGKAWTDPQFAQDLRREARAGILAANRRYNKNRTRTSIQVQPRSFE